MTEAASKSAAKSKSDEKTQDSYSQDYLVENARQLLGCGSHVAVGAFTLTSKKTMTVDEAKSAVKRFLNRPVEVDEPETEDQQED